MNKSRIKGVRFEREVVSLAKSYSLSAHRCWGSDGRSEGLSKNVDLVIEGIKLQAKSLKELPKYLDIEDGTDGFVFKRNRINQFSKGETAVLIPLDMLLNLLKGNSHEKTNR